MIPVNNRLRMPTVRDFSKQVQHDISNMKLRLEHVVITSEKESQSKGKIIQN